MLVVTYVEVFVEGSEDDVACSDIIGNPLVVVSDDVWGSWVGGHGGFGIGEDVVDTVVDEDKAYLCLPDVEVGARVVEPGR